MPNIKSAKKRVIVSAKKNLRNKSIRTNLRTVIKKANAAIESGASEETTMAARLAIKKIDQAVAKGVLHKNTAARKKSAIARRLGNA
ncbi:MAG: 30S ribosomal protein S20 [Ruminococcaceae bacterium]|nr:30S ribosomal protein S20 [Oscillospiraceae bacterium]